MLVPSAAVLIWLVAPLAVWTLFWKLPAVWFSARRGEKVWFAALSFVNAFGILEIYYLHSRKCWPFRESA